MAVPSDLVARTYENISAGVDISVPIPTFEINDIYVYYGKAGIEALYATDYAIVLEPDYAGFTLKPTATLLNKINALIAADPTETNYITVRRTLDMLTDTSAANMRSTVYSSKEIDRSAMRDQQLTERLNRALTFGDRFAGEQPMVALQEITPGAVLMFNEDGTAIVAGPDASQVEDAQAAAERVLQAEAIVLAAANFTMADLPSLLAFALPFPVGAKIITRAEGFSYEVVSSGAHLTTAGGIGLRVLPDARGEYPLAAMGLTLSLIHI